MFRKNKETSSGNPLSDRINRVADAFIQSSRMEREKSRLPNARLNRMLKTRRGLDDIGLN